MHYKFTFEDGSSGYLAHYGVQGMKWGQWNSETRARYANAGNGTYYKKATRGSEFGKAVTNQRRQYNANQSKGKQVLKNIAMTPLGAHGYNTARSRGLSRSESLLNASMGPLYAQGVKAKQINMGTTKAQISNAAKMRSEYSNSQSMRKDILKNIALGPVGATSYNTIKAATKSRGKALVGTLLPAAVGGAAGGAAVGLALHPSVLGGPGTMAALNGLNAVSNVASTANYIPRAQSYVKRDLIPKLNGKSKK